MSTEAENLQPHTPEEIAEALRLHKLWLESKKKEGERFDLKRLRGANLYRANLENADLTNIITDENTKGLGK